LTISKKPRLIVKNSNGRSINLLGILDLAQKVWMDLARKLRTEPQK